MYYIYVLNVFQLFVDANFLMSLFHRTAFALLYGYDMLGNIRFYPKYCKGNNFIIYYNNYYYMVLSRDSILCVSFLLLFLYCF